MRTPRDNQRSKVYAAERDANHLHGWGRFESVADIQAYVDGLGLKVRIKVEARPRANRGCARPWKNSIHLPVFAWTPMYVLHEVAHCLWPGSPGRAWHGPTFVAGYLELVWHFMGAEAWDALRAAFESGNVKIGDSIDLTKFFKRVTT